MPTFEDLLRQARASRGIDSPPAPPSDERPAWRRALEATAPDVPDMDPAAVAERDEMQAAWEQATAEMFGQPGGPLVGARPQGGTLPPPPGPCPACGRPMARVPGRPDYCPETACPNQGGASQPEQYVCCECRTVLDRTDHDDSSYLRRTCQTCKAAGRGFKVGRNTGITVWARIRTVPEYQDGEPAGTWRPAPVGQGMWERTPAGQEAAEVARRIATIY